MDVERDRIKEIWRKDNDIFMKNISSVNKDFVYHYYEDSFYKLYSLK